MPLAVWSEESMTCSSGFKFKVTTAKRAGELETWKENPTDLGWDEWNLPRMGRE